MRPHLVLALAVSAVVASAPPAAAGDGASVSIGYAFAHYLEEGGGSAPLGAYFSIASAGQGLGLEGDLAYHRDPVGSTALNTFTAAAGPRFRWGSGETRPYLHILGGLRHDSIEGVSNTAAGGMVGTGVDVPIGSSLHLRLGGDFQMFFDEGTNLKTLRLVAGLTF